jgi:hypothetical protein
MARTPVGGLSILIVSYPGVRGKQRWVAVVDVVAEVRKRIPADAVVELSNDHVSQEQATKLNLKPGNVKCVD